MLENIEIPAEPAPTVTVTETQFAELDAGIRAYLVAKAEADRAARELDEQRAELLRTVLKIDPRISTEITGLTVQRKTEIAYDKAEALEFLLREDNLAAAAGMLAVRDASRGVLVGAAIMTPALRSIFEIDDAGYKRAVRGELINGLPVTECKETEALAVSVKAVRFGEDLRKTLNVIEDPE